MRNRTAVKSSWLWVLPWAVVVTTHNTNCSYPSDLLANATSQTDNPSMVCESVEIHQVAYNDQVLSTCCKQYTDGGKNIGCTSEPPCDWMDDVVATFNVMAAARQAKETPPAADKGDAEQMKGDDAVAH